VVLSVLSNARNKNNAEQRRYKHATIKTAPEKIR
jgi:hypothetical protein